MSLNLTRSIPILSTFGLPFYVAPSQPLQMRANAGAAVLVVTHDPAVAAAADRHLALADGVLAA